MYVISVCIALFLRVTATWILLVHFPNPVSQPFSEAVFNNRTLIASTDAHPFCTLRSTTVFNSQEYTISYGLCTSVCPRLHSQELATPSNDAPKIDTKISFNSQLSNHLKNNSEITG